ncbi:SusC/RagA family TonB-linked outer membrane protein [Mucilaginibacter sp. AK015]|uniref:SusC/RagA family TonB-linked outer membrane protein n=1 Tax=Mucilaginibacter sp. AK015 TaxID=2723072 RepID=UPI0016122A4F|nr:SusC/RagA family TonB-linked outer membrane protein [Mucilaginibacter sp. AK015]MBB5395288.1 TonB-linked SusC/RagA family outer membrane protein [Mucilaginibacter sp. AK015]
MKKILLICMCFLLLFKTQLFAQERTVSGTVTAKEDGQPIPGVTVKIKGTTIGMQTGTDGKYAIKAANGAVLTFSFLGYNEQQLTVNKDIINVVLTVNSRQLGEVVVTGLGINKAKKTLGYAQTSVKNEEINKSAPINLLGGLQGKISGVNISNVSGAAGGSTKVILRGYTSIGGTNQPLYVVDGVPLNNSRSGSDDNFDFGNNANDIDPNLIDNISFLKGSAASAIYGSRGSNGVIVITTKKGKTGKPTVDFSSAATLTNVAYVYKPQEIFGQGWDGHFVPGENGNWGPKYDGQLRPWGAVVNNTQLIKPFSFIKNNIRDTYDNGLDFNNNITISGGTDASNYLLSYNNIHSDGVLPGNVDGFSRNNFTLKGGTNYKNFSADATLNYVAKNGSFVATGQGPTGVANTFYESVLQIPGDIPIKDLRDYKNLYFNTDNYYTPFAENPYYTLYENGSRTKTDRLYGNINLNYKLAPWVTLQLQQGADVSNAGTKIWYNSNSPTPGSWVGGGNTEGQSRAPDDGGVEEDNYQNYEYDTKLQALFVNKIGADFDINAVAGVNYNDRGSRSVATSIQGLAIPGFFNLSNSVNKPSSAESESHRRLVGFYGQATVGYKNYLYLTVTGRNDITSTLATGNNSYFYPAANASYILSQALDLKSSVVSYIKLRGSYGETGSDTDPYNINNVLSSTSVGLGFGSIRFPLQGVPGFTINNTLLNTNLRPERVKEYEFGGEFRFLNDRLGIDLTYYQRTRQDQILAVPIAPSGGYSFELVNFGAVRNRGIELAFSATPVKTSLVNWDINYTFSKSRSVVTALPDGLDKVILQQDGYGGEFVAIKDQPLGILQAPVPAYDPQGHIVVDSQGFPIAASANGSYGNFQHDFVMGFNSNIRVQNFTLGFTAEWDKGGKFYSGTADLFNFVGADPRTTYNDRNPFIVPNSVQQVKDANGNVTGYIENTTPISESDNDDYYYTTSNKALAWSRDILDRSFVKLREVIVNYNLPKSLTNKLGVSKASIGVYGRNLYTWLPAGNKVVDPEVSNYGTDLASEYGEFRTAPPLRYFGAALKVTF